MKFTDFDSIGFKPADILVPNSSVDLNKWSVVACDQYTSERDYWDCVDDYVGDSPSTLRMIFPECYLDDGNKQERIQKINSKMNEYLKAGFFDEYKNCFFLTKRTTSKGFRLGLIGCLDLEKYDYNENSKSIIRATEGTIVSRIPPRKEIRKDAQLELPHILVLISDCNKKIIEPLYANRFKYKQVYNTQLMMNSGSVEAYLINDEESLGNIEKEFVNLANSTVDSENPLLFAMGDGNHSFATAKSCWEDIKKNLSEEEKKNNPARYCLVEIENIFDDGIVFEPINRVLFNVPETVFLEELEKCASSIDYEIVGCKNCIAKRITNQQIQGFGYCIFGKHVYVRLTDPSAFTASGTIQIVLDSLLKKGYCIDYIHGDILTDNLGSEKGNIGIFLPSIDKYSFFDAIVKDGALPRKTFSMGEPDEKRFYLESRKIK